MSKVMSLEATIDRLEQVVAEMENDISIDEALKNYAEAVKLIEQAGGKLAAARLKVEKLSATKSEQEVQDEPV